MEDKENDEIIPVNDDAPPVLMPPNQINNNNINNHNLNNNINNNINNINIDESNFNLLPNNINNKNQINENKQFQIYNNNKNIRPQIPIMYMNNYYRNGFQPYLLRNQMYRPYMYFNCFNQQQNRNINNINNHMSNILNNNINNSINNINENQIKDNSNTNLHGLKLDIDSKVLNAMCKNYLLDIILFIVDFCQIKIEPKFIRMKHDIFRIKKDKNRDNQHIFFIKKNKLNDLLYPKYENYINNDENNSESNSDDYEYDEKNNINNDKNFSSNNILHIPKYKNNNLENFYCEVHEKVFMNTNKNAHYKKHLKCEKCGAEVRSKRLLKIHRNSLHHENIPKIVNEKNNKGNNKDNINNSNNIELLKKELNPNMNMNIINKENEENIEDIENEEKIKCSDCDLFFNTVELMSEHFYEIHEKNKIKNNINNEKDSFKNNEEIIINKDEEENEEEEDEEEIKKEKKEHKKDELKKSKELKKQLDVKKQEEKKRTSKLTQLLNAIEEEKQKRIQNNINYYKCYIDKKVFNDEQKYIMHFVHCHNGDYPFYCKICDKGFWSSDAKEKHSKAKGHYD